ncbi:hypothetical protein [Porticoccus sp.]|jgi:hypothetical protein
MRKPNTSFRGYEAPSLRPPDCGYRLADYTLLMADTQRREGGPSRRTDAAGLPHLKISNTG